VRGVVCVGGWLQEGQEAGPVVGKGDLRSGTMYNPIS
jgi:hypothetical protein